MSRVGRRNLATLREGLSGRDLAILGQVGELRLMSARQLEAIFFPIETHATALTAARSARRVLERLTRDRLLVRLERRVGGVRAGSASFIYALGSLGQRLSSEDQPRRRLREPSSYFVTHTLAVAQLVVDLNVAARRGGCELLQLQAEPACWRTFGGLAGRTVLRPDLFVAVGIGDYEHRWFVEVDLGSESLPRLVAKCRSYEAYYRTGSEQAAHDVFPRVLWLMSDQQRGKRLLAEIERAGSSLSPGLFVVGVIPDALPLLSGGSS